MKPNHAQRNRQGITIVEVLVCVVVVVLLLGFLLPRSGGEKFKASRISCVSRLKQIGLASRMWANDNPGQFPWQVSMTASNPGTQEFALTGDVWKHFLAISKELNNPKILACPSDKSRTPVSDWASFTNNAHLSYFVGLDASEVFPQSILSGDRNLTVSNKAAQGILFLKPGDTLGWTKALHEGQGNFGLGDGSVQQINSGHSANRQLEAAFQSATQSVIRISLPQ